MTSTYKTDEMKLDYEFRINRGLVLFLTVDDKRVTQFADMLHSECSQIKSINLINRYDSHQSAIVGEMFRGYCPQTAQDEIYKCFKQIFMTAK